MNAADFRTGGGLNLTTSQDGITYIFPIPSESPLRNCSGTVVSLQYCYEGRTIDLGITRNAFNFLTLVQNGLQFTVNSSVTIQTTPRNSICTDPLGIIQEICCDSASLTTNDQFQFPSSNFAFGVVVTNRNIRPLAFANSAIQYRIEQYQISLGVPTVGNTFTLSEGVQVNDSSLLFRLFIGKAFKVK